MENHPLEQLAAQTSRTNMVSQLLSLDLFKAFDTSTLQDLEAELRSIHLGAGEILVRQGDVGDSMYVLVRGRLQVTLEHPDGTQQVVDELDPGVTVGEMALITGQVRSATVAAIDDAELVQLSKGAFDRLSEKDPEPMMQFARSIVPRVRRVHLAGTLRELFGNLSAPALRELEAELEWHHLRNGEALFRQGDPGDALYIVINGRLRIVVENADRSKRVLGEVGRGETVGEFALLTGEDRSATLYAIRDTDVVRLPQATFERLLQQYPHAMMQISRIIVKRTLETSRPGQGTTLATFALIPAGGDVPLSDVAQRLREALAVFGPTLHLNSERFDKLIGKEGVAQTPDDHPARFTLISWLGEQETKYRYIVYEADPAWSSWTSRCIHQADRVLIVAQAGADPTPGEIETAMGRFETMAREELVLLHPAGTRRPTGTRQWLNRRGVAAHHHVRFGVDADMQRLARRLTGRALGLVLGGGGARGYAHIGVIRALEEASLPVDLVGGTSMGALMGGLYAMGMPPPAIATAARRFGSPRELFDYTVPLVALFRSKKVSNVLHTLFEDTQIEDLWRPFFCVSSNLTQARPVIHQEGPLWKAVRASTAIPGIFSPVLDEGEILVDGVAMNNLPIDVMHALSEGGPVIAVKVAPDRDLAEHYAFESSISGWQVLWRKLNPFAQPIHVPSIFDILARSREINDVYQRQAKHALADLYIAPPLEPFPLLDFSRCDEIVEVGYHAARQALQTWPVNLQNMSLAG